MKIVLPMIKPILATIFVLNALWVWNDFQMPLLILNQSQDMWTLPLFQYNFKSQYSFDYNLAFASYLIAMIDLYFLLILISSSSHHDQNHTSSGKKICLGVIDGSVVFENQSIGVAALIFYTLMRMYRH